MRRAQQPQDCSRRLCCIFRSVGKYVKALEGIHIITKGSSHCRQWDFHFHLIKTHQHGADRRGCTILPDPDDRGFHRDTVYCHFKSSAQHICCTKHGDRAVFPDHTDLIGRFIICFCKISSFDDYTNTAALPYRHTGTHQTLLLVPAPFHRSGNSD